MAANSENLQLIARLTPLADVLGALDSTVQPVPPRAMDLHAAVGRVLSSPAVAPSRPASPLALIDGWALNADATLDAGTYAPALLPEMPERVEVGQPMPGGADSVAPLDTVTVKGDRAEALGTVSFGEGVIAFGADCDSSLPLRRAGTRLRITDAAVLAAAGLARVTAREPRFRVVPVRGSTIVTAAARMIADDLERHGGTVRLESAGVDLDMIFGADNSDALVVIGGTGSGRNDSSVQTLARAGKIAFHGIALSPGETTALGFIGSRPVLLLPGRLDAALAGWLVIGRRILAKLSGALEDEVTTSFALARKIASPVGIAEFVPVRRSGEQVEPLAAKYLPFSALARADGWILVPAESEGFGAGATVPVYPWPGSAP